MPDRAATERLVAGRYALQHALGRGGMGVVWRARDTLLERDVAVKEVQFPPGVSDDERRVLRTRVFREARAAARLSHPCVVTVYDVIEEDDRPYIVMELVDAPSLGEVVQREGPLSPQRAARIGLDVLSALDLAHAAGVVHRDIKPGNVMVRREGHSELADFGIASVKDDPSVTSTGLVLGSPAYMAPEQGSRGVTSPASDLWSLGATLFYAVEGTPPFEGNGALPTLTAVVNEPAKPMRCAGPLAPLINRLLSKDPDVRPQHAEVRAELERVAADTEPVTTAAMTAIDPYPTEPDPADTMTLVHPAQIPVTTPARTPGAVRRPHSTPARTYNGGGSGWRVVGGLIAVIAVLALGSYLFTLLARDRDGATTDPKSRATTAPATAPRQSAKPSPSAKASATPRQTSAPAKQTAPGGVPADWKTYRHGPTGYTIKHPPGWTVAEDGPNTDFKDPQSGSYLRVAWTDDPGSDPVQRWHEVEDSFRRRHDNYQRIRIDPATYQGLKAAEWEFTYTSRRGNRLHAIDLGFVNRDYGFALYWQTAESRWASSQPRFEAFKSAFELPPR